jgi:Icc-related predicted phosphoesterase
MIIGAVADIHGDFDALDRAMSRHPDVPLWLCVGDLASASGAYPMPRARLYFIKGNNENFTRLAEWQQGTGEPMPNLHFITNGTAVTIGPLTVAGLGGTFAPTIYDTPAALLPHTPSNDRRRHFVREEVDACKRLRGVDIFMTHEAPRPFIIVDDERPGRPARRRDAGKPAINEVLAAMKPRLHLYGHHHRFIEGTREGVRSVCIDAIDRSYLLIDGETLGFEKIDQ